MLFSEERNNEKKRYRLISEAEKSKKAYIYKYVSVFWKAVFVDDLFVGENSNLESVMAAKNFRGELF